MNPLSWLYQTIPINNSFVQELSHFSLNEYSSYLNWYLSIRDSDLNKDFRAYSIVKRSYFPLFCFALFLTLVVIPLNCYLVIQSALYNSYDPKFFSYPLVFFACQVVLACSNWAVVLMKKYPKMQKYDGFISTSFICSATTIIVLKLLRNYIFPCSKSWAEAAIGRDCTIDQHYLGWDTGAYMLIPPIAFIIILKETRFIILLLSFCSVLTTIIFVVLYFHPFSVINLIFWIIGGIVVLFELYIQNIKSFFLKRKLIETMIENEKINEQNQANEMRHMIANVAHDLKTPLASFTSGLEMIEQVLVEINECYQDQTLTSEFTQEKCFMMNQSLEDIRNTNSFMLMTINRCIDYTKASKGMKLVPRYETIDLMETLRLPLNCMRNIQNRITMKLNTISEDVCSHIITDKQWLQENILCLLSNAVKYSSQGEVTIQLTLTNSEENSNYITHSIENPGLKFKFIHPFKKSFHSNNNSKVFPSSLGFSSALNETPSSSPKANKIKNSETRKDLNIKNDLEQIPGPETQELFHSIDETLNVSSKNESFDILLFEIEDTGIGMSDEAMKSLFNPFKQTQRLAGGTGLGLYSLAKRIEALNGKYGVKHRRDGKQGSLFWFTMPYKPDQVSANIYTRLKSQSSIRSNNHFNSMEPLQITKLPPAKNEAKFLLPSPKFSSHQRNNTVSLDILVVDDSPTVLKMTSLMLKRQGHDVQQAENGEIAVKMIETRWKDLNKVYDLVLMDLQMPVMDGLEATRRIRKLESEYPTSSSKKIEIVDVDQESSMKTIKSKQIIIGCSANSDTETIEEAIKIGIDGFIPKPFTMETFHNITKQYVYKCK